MHKNQTVLLELSVYSFFTILLIADSITRVYLPFSILSTFFILFFATGRLTILSFSSNDEGNPINNLFDFRGNLSNNTFATLLSISSISLFSLLLGLSGAYSISIVKASVCLYVLLLIFLVAKRYSLSFYHVVDLVRHFSLPSLIDSREHTTSWQKAYFLASLVIISFVYLDDGENSELELELEFYLLSETGNIDDLRDEFQVGETVTLFTGVKGPSGAELTFLCTITNTENGESEEIYSDEIIIQDGISSVPLSINLLSEGPRILNFYLYSDNSNDPIRDLYYSFEVVQ